MHRFYRTFITGPNAKRNTRYLDAVLAGLVISGASMLVEAILGA